jgi:hypothetical protein
MEYTSMAKRRTTKGAEEAVISVLVVIAVEDKGDEGFDRIRLRRIVDASGSSLTEFVQENIESGNTLRTNGWKGYNHISFMGYRHIVVHKNASIGKNMLPLAHRIAALLIGLSNFSIKAAKDNIIF